WEKLERSENPFAVVVMAHLKAQELNLGEGEERKQWKLRLIRLLYERGFERKNVLQLFRFIDWLLMLPPELEKIFTEEVHKIEEEKNMEYITSVERVGIEKGIKQGVLQGIEQGMLLNTRGVLLEVLSLRFGPPATDLCELIEGIKDYETLKRLHRSAVLCGSLEEFRAGLARKV
ncbi:MAG: transposase, partial [Candidatus Electrothrix sp. MAN1_4]|nr:transposase [Candidatus Electrothrix sp. MAN1_4]